MAAPAAQPMVEEVEEEAIIHNVVLTPGLWFESRGDLHRLHDSLRYHQDFIHDLLQQPFFREELRNASIGEPVTERFAHLIYTLVHEDLARRRSHLLLALASGVFNLRLGAASSLRFVSSWDVLVRILPLASSS